MRIGCSRCQTQYDLPDEKLKRGAAKIRCTRCGHVFVVKRREAEPPPSSVTPEAGLAELNFDLSAPSEQPTPPSQSSGEPAGWGELDLSSPDSPEASDHSQLAAVDDADAGSFDLGSMDFSAPPRAPEVSAREVPPGQELDGSPGPERTGSAPSGSAGEASFDDFDFGSFEAPDAEGSTARPELETPPKGAEHRDEEEFLSSADDLPSLGELDLGEFDDGASGGFEGAAGTAPTREAPSEPAERIRGEDLVSPALANREMPLQGLTEEIPRLDLQRGPRRQETSGTPSPLLASDRRRSPLLWVVVAAVLSTGGYTAYNAYRHPEALTFLSPQRIRELWRNRDVEAKFTTEDVKGYGQDLPGGRKVFVIRGRVVNKSGSAQGLIRVKGNLFSRDGSTLATGEVYCGNQLSDRELAVLPRATIEARLQNQVGEALSNVDIAPGSKVPFMLVFPAPSSRVENFNVLVSAWRGGGS